MTTIANYNLINLPCGGVIMMVVTGNLPVKFGISGVLTNSVLNLHSSGQTLDYGKFTKIMNVSLGRPFGKTFAK